MFGPGGTKFKKSKSKHSDRSSEAQNKITNLMINTAADQEENEHQAAKSDHGAKKFGFFENFRRKVVGLGR